MKISIRVGKNTIGKHIVVKIHPLYNILIFTNSKPSYKSIKYLCG